MLKMFCFALPCQIWWRLLKAQSLGIWQSESLWFLRPGIWILNLWTLDLWIDFSTSPESNTPRFLWPDPVRHSFATLWKRKRLVLWVESQTTDMNRYGSQPAHSCTLGIPQICFFQSPFFFCTWNDVYTVYNLFIYPLPIYAVSIPL